MTVPFHSAEFWEFGLHFWLALIPICHDGVIVSFDIKTDKLPPKTKTIYDYKNADIAGLCQYIKEYDFENLVFSSPVLKQTELYTNVLIDAFSKFVPSKNVIIRPFDAPWCTKFTRLLLRKKNRNYLFYKKCDKEYRNSSVIIRPFAQNSHVCC